MRYDNLTLAALGNLICHLAAHPASSIPVSLSIVNHGARYDLIVTEGGR